MLSDDEILRRLKAVRHSPVTERLARRSVSVRQIAGDAKVAREHLYRIIRGERPITADLRDKLSHVLEM